MKNRKLLCCLISLFLFCLSSQLLHSYTKPAKGAPLDDEGKANPRYFGPLVVRNETVSQINVYGSLEGDNIWVKKDLTVYGPVDLNQVNINGQMTIYGTLRAFELMIKGAAQVQGDAQIRESEFYDSLDLKGPCELNHVNIKGSFTAFGELDAESLTVKGDSDIKGTSSLKETTFHGSLSIFGKIKAKHLKAESSATFNSNHIDLIDSYFSSNLTIEDNETGKQQLLYLRNGSIIQGNLVFNNPENKNIVYMEKSAKVSGKIIGAEVKHL